MGCGCGKTKRVYVVTTKAGSRREVDSLSAAISVVRKEGGSYEILRK